MPVLDIAGDARRAVDAVAAGGVVIIPTEVGYAGIGGNEAALLRFFHAKGRGAHKRNAMLGSLGIHEEVHDAPPRPARWSGRWWRTTTCRSRPSPRSAPAIRCCASSARRRWPRARRAARWPC